MKELKILGLDRRSYPFDIYFSYKNELFSLCEYEDGDLYIETGFENHPSNARDAELFVEKELSKNMLERAAEKLLEARKHESIFRMQL